MCVCHLMIYSILYMLDYMKEDYKAEMSYIDKNKSPIYSRDNINKNGISFGFKRDLINILANKDIFPAVLNLTLILLE